MKLIDKYGVNQKSEASLKKLCAALDFLNRLAYDIKLIYCMSDFLWSALYINCPFQYSINNRFVDLCLGHETRGVHHSLHVAVLFRNGRQFMVGRFNSDLVPGCRP